MMNLVNLLTAAQIKVSAYFEKQNTKEKLDQIDLRIVIFLNLRKGFIASNFDPYSRPLKSDIFKL